MSNTQRLRDLYGVSLLLTPYYFWLNAMPPSALLNVRRGSSFKCRKIMNINYGERYRDPGAPGLWDRRSGAAGDTVPWLPPHPATRLSRSPTARHQPTSPASFPLLPPKGVKGAPEKLIPHSLPFGPKHSGILLCPSLLD